MATTQYKKITHHNQKSSHHNQKSSHHNQKSSHQENQDKIKVQTMKQTEIGWIPEDWKVLKLSEIANVKTGPFGSALHEKDYVVDGIPIITVEHLGERGVLKATYPMVNESDYKRLSNYVLSKGDIVFSRVGSVDRNSLIKEYETGWLFSGRLLRIRPNQYLVNSQYLSFFFNENSFKARIVSVAVGQTMASLNTKILNDILIYLPPLPEQEAIATALSDCDAWIDSLEAVLAKKRLIKQGAMQELLTPKEDWEVKKLEELVKVAKSGGTPLSSNKEYYNGNIPFLSISDMTNQGKYLERTSNKISQAGLDNSTAWIVPIDSIIYSMYASVGFVSINKIELATSQAVLNLIIKDEYTLDYIYYYLVSIQDTILKFVGEGTQKNLNAQTVRNFDIHIPKSLTEQTRIATILSDMDAEIEALEGKLEKARQIKQGMMQELLTGRVRLV